MIAYHGRLDLKELMITEAVQHRILDHLKQNNGYYSIGYNPEKWTGCKVGCAIHTFNTRLGGMYDYSDHSAYGPAIGFPCVLAELADSIFERLPSKLAQTWPERFFEAVQVGADLSKVGARFIHWLLVDSVAGISQHVGPEAHAVIVAVGELYARRINGDIIHKHEWFLINCDDVNRICDVSVAATIRAAIRYGALAYAIDATTITGLVRVVSYKKQSEKLLKLMAAAPVKEKTEEV